MLSQLNNGSPATPYQRRSKISACIQMTVQRTLRSTMHRYISTRLSRITASVRTATQRPSQIGKKGTSRAARYVYHTSPQLASCMRLIPQQQIAGRYGVNSKVRLLLRLCSTSQCFTKHPANVCVPIAVPAIADVAENISVWRKHPGISEQGNQNH